MAEHRRGEPIDTFSGGRFYGEHAARGAVPPEHLERLIEGE